jgi:RNA recognition motif-containing protein
MSKRIYVGNLPFNASDTQIRKAFSRHGKVLRVEVQRGGTAIVEMADDLSAERAIKALHQTEMGGKSLNVNEARRR